MQEKQTGIASGSPPVPPAQNDAANAQEQPNLALAKPSLYQMFFAWEKLHLLYNAVLFVAVVCTDARWNEALLDRRFIPALIIVAALANAYFFLGPIIEERIARYGAPRSTVRPLVFSGITTTAVVYFIAVLNCLVQLVELGEANK